MQDGLLIDELVQSESLQEGFVFYWMRHLRSKGSWDFNDPNDKDELRTTSATAVFLGAANAAAFRFLSEMGFDAEAWIVDARKSASDLERAYDHLLVYKQYPEFAKYRETVRLTAEEVRPFARRAFYDLTCGRKSIKEIQRREVVAVSRIINNDVDYDIYSPQDDFLAHPRATDNPFEELVVRITDRLIMTYGPRRAIYEVLERLYFHKESTKLLRLLSDAWVEMSRKEFDRHRKSLARQLQDSEPFMELVRDDPAIQELYSRICLSQ